MAVSASSSKDGFTHPRRPSRRDLAVVVTCEHGGNSVPARYRFVFAGRERVLESHRGWDPGALSLARTIARACDAPLVATTTTRLLVECNRSMGHPQLFSEFTRHLSPDERVHVLDRFYHPHRHAVEVEVLRALSSHRRVVHIGVHTFTPVLDGKRRLTDIGLLYDPARPFDVAAADALDVHLHLEAPELRIRRNYPYRGWTDGLITSLRQHLPRRRYAGIELEVSQAFPRGNSRKWRLLQGEIAAAVAAAFVA